MKYFIHKILFSISILICQHAFFQPSISWTKCFGGSSDDYAKTITKTTDNGFLIVGGATSFDGDVTGIHGDIDSVTGNMFTLGDAWVIKTDSIGNIEWQKCLGGSGIDVGISGVETQGGYVIVCGSNSFDGDVHNNHGGHDYWLIKLDYSGNIIWEYSYGGNQSEEIYGLAPTPDGGFALSGRQLGLDNGDIVGHHGSISSTDIWVVKVDSLGILQWQRCIGGTHMELHGAVALDIMGNIYIASSSGSIDYDVTCIGLNGINCWLVKLDANGNILWDRCFGGSGIGQIYAIEISGNKILLSGTNTSSDGDLTHNYGYRDAWILVTDTAGNKIFSQSYGGSQTEELVDACFLDNGNIVACGYTNSNDSDVTFNYSPVSVGHGWLICTDSLGNLLWQKVYGGSSYDRLVGIISDQHNVVRFIGTTDSPNNGDVVGSHGRYDLWFVNLDIVTGLNEFTSVDLIKIYPQPFSDIIYVQIPFISKEVNSATLIDLQGKKINTSTFFETDKLIVKPEGKLEAGWYILELILNNKPNYFKILKM